MDTTENVNALRAEVEGLARQHEEMERAVSRFRRLLIERRLALYDATGEGESYDAHWLRAWLASEHKECDRILAQQYPGGDTAKCFAARWGEPVNPLRIMVEEHRSHVATVDAPAGYDAEAHAASAGLVLADAADDEHRASVGQ